MGVQYLKPALVIYYYVIWTDNGSTLPEADTWEVRGEISNDKSITGLHP